MKCDYCCQPIDGVFVNHNRLNYHLHCLAHFETAMIRHAKKIEDWGHSNQQYDGLAGNHSQDRGL